LDKLSQSEKQEIGMACAPHDAALKATGRVEAQASLSEPDSWSHFVPKDGKPTLRQGPYIRNNRQAGAFFIIEADSVEEAQKVASKHAAANYGDKIGFAVEIRGCETFQSYALRHAA
jgi:hypothetical protein